MFADVCLIVNFRDIGGLGGGMRSTECHFTPCLKKLSPV